MKYTVEQFKADVIAECNALREHATPEELGRVNKEIDPLSTTACIYGRMTGSCKSVRAVDLIRKCCMTSIELLTGWRLILSEVLDDSIMKAVKGTIAAEGREDEFDYLSALEAYIHFPAANIPAIQSYLTGQTQTLEL